MERTFRSTARALDGEHSRVLAVGLVAVGVLAMLWVAWFTSARVPVYVVAHARVESRMPAKPVDAGEHGGVVKAIHVALGNRVQQGDVLLELEAHGVHALLEAEKARVRSTQGQLAAIAAQIAEQDSAMVRTEALYTDRRRVLQAELDEARARLEAATDVLERVKELQSLELAPDVEITRAQSDATVAEALVRARSHSLAMLDAERRGVLNDRLNERRETEAEQQHIAGTLEIARAGVEHYEHELEHYVVRASVTGTIGYTASVVSGSYLTRGELVARIIPDSDFRIIATLTGGPLVGTVRPDHGGYLDLDAFPWLVHGAVPVTVSAVASESGPRGTRVELEPEPGGTPEGVVLTHGLSGRVRIEVDRITPLKRFLAYLGRGKATSSPPEAVSRLDTPLDLDVTVTDGGHRAAFGAPSVGRGVATSLDGFSASERARERKNH